MNRIAAPAARRGFSLVELVIVILILGILAAVAAPRMFDRASDARANGTRQSLVVIRNAIEMYRAEKSKLPTTSITTELATYLQGPFPSAQIGNQGNTVRIQETGAALSPSGTESWAYDTKSGQFIVNHADGSGW